MADPADDPEVVLQKKNRSEALRHSLARLSLFRAKDGSDGPPSGRNGERDFHDERRSATSAESCEAAQMNWRKRVAPSAMCGPPETPATVRLRFSAWRLGVSVGCKL